MMAETTTMRLADLCDFVGVQVDPTSCADEAYVGLEHVPPGRFTRTSAGKASDVQSAKYAFQPGDVLYGKLRPYLDKAVLVSDSGICTTELLVLRPKDGIDPRFLVGAIHAPTFIEYALAGTTGVQHPRTSWNHISKFEMPAFDPGEQNEIAKLLDKMQRAITANEDVVNAGTDLRQSAMRILFKKGPRGGVQKETKIGPIPRDWEVAELGDLFEIVQGLSLKGNLSNDGDGVPFLRTSNVYWGRIDLDSVSRMNVDPDRIEDRTLEPGDLLVCEGGEIGRAAVWNGEMTHCTYQNHLHRLRAKQANRIDVKFTAAWLEEGFLHRNVYAGVGNRTTIPNLSRARLAELPMPCPPLEEQREIVTILNAIDRKVDLHRQKRAVFDDLFKTLLHKLITGEIRVTNLDPSVWQGLPKNGGATYTITTVKE